MAKVKLKRKQPNIDMTPMVDLAFLLVTFFMLTTSFRPQEPYSVSIPASVSELKIPKQNIMKIIMTSDGKVFFDLSGQSSRRRLLEGMANKYSIQFTPKEKQEFEVMASFGMPIGSLRQFLALDPKERDKVEQPGIPIDSTNNQLVDWIKMARLANPKARIAIKGDKDAAYPIVDKVINTIQDAGVNRFNLVTSLKQGPKKQ